MAFRPKISRSQIVKLGLTSFTVAILTIQSAMADDPAKLIQVQPNTAQDQLILGLSNPSIVSLVAPYEKGKRHLLIDIPNATLSDLPDKDQLSQQILQQLPDIQSIHIDEFRGTEPLVRIAIITKDPEITGALSRTSSNTWVIQFVKTSLAFKNQPTNSQGEDTTTITTTTVQRTTTVTENPDTLKERVKESKEAELPLEKQLAHKTFEAESLRKERNRLVGQVNDLKIRVEQQDKFIKQINAEASHLVPRESFGPAKQQIVTLQQQLTSLEASYSELKNTLNDVNGQLSSTEAQRAQAEQDAQGLQEALQKEQHGTVPQTAAARGGLLNTLDTLTAPEITQLLNAEKAYREGKKFEFQNDAQQAEAKYKEALRFAPQVQDYALALGELYLRQGRYTLARGVFDAGLQYHPDDTNLLNEGGKSALLDKDDALALKYFSRALPSGVLSNYASALRKANQPDLAETLYKLAITANPADSDLQFNLGNLYLAEKRYPEAKARFSEALRLNPDFPEAHFHLGLISAEQGQVPQAITEFNTYLKMMPNAPNKETVQHYVNQLIEYSNNLNNSKRKS